VIQLLQGNINQTLVNSLHSLLNFEIGGLDRSAITTEYVRVYKMCPLNSHVTPIL